MAFRKHQLMEIGGFDPQFLVAGDDVDVCWRLQERGWTIGFSPAAVVWHHRRNSVRRYLKQQWGYAKAEALLSRKWPTKYNGAGHVTWHGRVYGKGAAEMLFKRNRIYHGTWGCSPFQSVYGGAAGKTAYLLLMPEWYAVLTVLFLLVAAGLSWPPLLLFTPLFVAGLTVTIAQAACGGIRAELNDLPRSPFRRFGMMALTTWLHLVQPMVRMLGRMQHGLGPWRKLHFDQPPPLPFNFALWSERWQAPEERLAATEAALQQAGAVVYRGGDFDDWDLSVSGGLFGSARALAMVEEHGAGKQLFRLRAWPRVPTAVIVVSVSIMLLAAAALAGGAWIAGLVLASGGLVFSFRAYLDCAAAMAQIRNAVARLEVSDAGEAAIRSSPGEER
jgi:hypothetical protein